jgi:O-antigen ligase
MMTMTGILTAEILIMGVKGGRLSWPYGDLVPGNYLTKVGFPAFATLIALAVSPYKSVRGWASLASLITVILSVITGERINFILRACGGMLAGLMWRPSIYRYGALIFIEVLAVITILIVTPDTGNRFTKQFFSEISIDAESPYYRVMYGAVVVFEKAPILGIGTANYRILCTELTQHAPDVDCNTHPHNYYLQILGETGIIGLISGSVMIISIIWFCFVTGVRRRANVLAATAFILPLGLFFPIQTTADFFGQWNNIFMWSAIALALATRNLVVSDEKTFEEK